MKFLVDNWCAILCGILAVTAVGGSVILSIVKFSRLTRAEKERRVKEWLLYAVAQAEKELGGGTGRLKLRRVYDLFLQRFPTLAAVIPFETFCQWVDEALIEMRKLLSNQAVKEFVEGVKGC